MLSQLRGIFYFVLIILVLCSSPAAAEPLHEYTEARNMYLFAAACLASYDDMTGQMATEALKSNGWSIEKFFKSSKNANIRFLLAVKTQPESGEPMYLIAVAGTETLQDLAADFSFNKVNFSGHSLDELKQNASSEVETKEGPKVHWGFFQYALAAWELDYQDVKNATERRLIKELVDNPARKIYLVGHSMGGAVVTLGAAGLINIGIDPSRIEVVSFGAPAVGNAAFRREFESKINLTRVVMHGDPVSRILQDAVGGYEQFGRQLIWNTKEKSLGEAHEMELYLDVAMKNYYKTRRAALAAGVIAPSQQSLIGSGKSVYILPLANNLPPELSDEYTYMQDAMTDAYQGKVSSYYLAGKRAGFPDDFKAAAAMNCQLVAVPEVHADKLKYKNNEYTVVLEQCIYEAASGSLVAMQTFSSTTRNMTPLESFVHNTINLGQQSSEWLAK